MTFDRFDLKENLLKILEQLESLSKNAPQPVKLVAVSKTKPVELILEAYQAGQKIFGENRVQEAGKKKEQLPVKIDWHLIGSLQKNKAKYCPGLFSAIHSIDNYSLAEELDRRCAQKQTSMNIFVQMNLSGENTKSGIFTYREALELVGSISEKLKNLKPIGLMTIPDPNFSEEKTSNCYAILRRYLEDISRELNIAGSFRELSMGMSNDYPLAIREGATYVRIGSSIFGHRGI